MASKKSLLLILIVSLTALLSPAQTHAQSPPQQACIAQKHSNNVVYDSCADLPTLNSYLHWTYSPANSTLSVAFLAPSSGWVSWAINPTGTGMAGAQALLAFRNDSDGSMAVKTYNIASYGSILEADLDGGIRVLHKSAESSDDGMMKIYATLALPHSLSSAGKINHLWQVGPSFTGGRPTRHAFGSDILNSMGTLDLPSSSGPSAGPTAASSFHTSAHKADGWTTMRNAHGIMNGVSWGILFPLGVIVARYMRAFESADPAWFYLHISCQMLGYALGVAGWATGLALGSHSKGIVYKTHRSIGIALFCFATNQIFAMRLRPKKDSKYRLWWTIYHRSIGYAIVVLGIINVFGGLHIMQPGKKWKLAYTILLIVLASISVLLEAVTWVLVLVKRRRSNKPANPSV